MGRGAKKLGTSADQAAGKFVNSQKAQYNMGKEGGGSPKNIFNKMGTQTAMGQAQVKQAVSNVGSMAKSGAKTAANATKTAAKSVGTAAKGAAKSVGSAVGSIIPFK